MELKERIKLLVSMFGGTQTEFAKNIGTTQSTITSWISRESIPTAALQKVAEVYPNVDINWLLTGEGAILKEPINVTVFSQWAVTPKGFTPNVIYSKGTRDVTIHA